MFKQRGASKGRRHRIAGSESAIRPSIELHIEELTLDGFSPGDRYYIGDSLERELTRLFVTHGIQGLARKSSSTDRLDLGSFNVGQYYRKEEVGLKVAESVYRGLHR